VPVSFSAGSRRRCTRGDKSIANRAVTYGGGTGLLALAEIIRLQTLTVDFPVADVDGDRGVAGEQAVEIADDVIDSGDKTRRQARLALIEINIKLHGSRSSSAAPLWVRFGDAVLGGRAYSPQPF
jgi:hypothetical protein